jgi:hypothetical protein
MMIISDEPLDSVGNFLLEAIRDLHGREIHGVAIVAAINDPKNGLSYMTGYHEMSAVGMQLAAAQIQADIVDDIIAKRLDEIIEDFGDDDL